MFCTIVNDCQDANAAGRQITRAVSLLNCPANLVGVQNDVEAAGNLVDVLDASEGRRGAIFVNVAPRNGRAKKWPNGTPFGYFWHKETLVLASVDGFTLSLVKKLGIADHVQLLETPAEHAKHQFRSFEFLPRVATLLLAGEELTGEQLSFTEVPEAPKVLWWIDNFGNCKTTVLPEEVHFEAGKTMQTTLGDLECFESLKDVPDEKTGLIIGSSGFERQRFLEVVKQGGNAAKDLGVLSGVGLY